MGRGACLRLGDVVQSAAVGVGRYETVAQPCPHPRRRSPAVVFTGHGTATVTITGDDGTSEPTLWLIPPATTTLAEDGAPVEFALNVSEPYFTPMHGFARVKRSGSANRWQGYRLEALEGGCWTEEHPGSTLRLRLVALPDGLSERDETVILTLLPQPQRDRDVAGMLLYVRGTPHLPQRQGKGRNPQGRRDSFVEARLCDRVA